MTRMMKHHNSNSKVLRKRAGIKQKIPMWFTFYQLKSYLRPRLSGIIEGPLPFMPSGIFRSSRDLLIIHEHRP